MLDKENIGPNETPPLFFKKQFRAKKSNSSRYTKVESKEFDQIEISLHEESVVDAPKKVGKKKSEIINVDTLFQKKHVKKVSDDDIVIYIEDEVVKVPGCMERIRIRLREMCRCNGSVSK